MVKVNFHRAMDFVQGDEDNEFFKSQLINSFRQGSTVKDVVEATALSDLLGEIARTENGMVELSKKDLDMLEKNFNRMLAMNTANIPNYLAAEMGALIKEGRQALKDG